MISLRKNRLLHKQIGSTLSLIPLGPTKQENSILLIWTITLKIRMGVTIRAIAMPLAEVAVFSELAGLYQPWLWFAHCFFIFRNVVIPFSHSIILIVLKV
jgi:hypothetical protein